MAEHQRRSPYEPGPDDEPRKRFSRMKPDELKEALAKREAEAAAPVEEPKPKPAKKKAKKKAAKKKAKKKTS